VVSDNAASEKRAGFKSLWLPHRRGARVAGAGGALVPRMWCSPLKMDAAK